MYIYIHKKSKIINLTISFHDREIVQWNLVEESTWVEGGTALVGHSRAAIAWRCTFPRWTWT